MHAVPYEARIHKCWLKMRGLPRRHSPAADGRKLRAVPYGERVDRICTSYSESLQPLPAVGRARIAAMRRLPQGRCDRSVPGVVDGVLFMPCEGFPEDRNARRQRTKPLGGGIPYGL